MRTRPGSQRTHQQRPQQLEFAHALAQTLQEQVFDALDLDGRAVDEGARRDDVGQSHDAGGVGEVARPGRPVEHHRQLAGQVQGDEGGIASDGRGQHQADVGGGQRGEAPAHGQRRRQHPFVGDDAGHVVGGGHVARIPLGAGDEGVRDGLAQDLQQAVAATAAPNQLGGGGFDGPFSTSPCASAHS